MAKSTEDMLTESALNRLANDSDPRFKQVITALIKHVHAFAREVELTEEEWVEGVKFLTAAGQKCDNKRQEFILLSDVLGLSMLVDAINHKRPAGATENTVLGPFFVHGAPEIKNGDNMAEDWEGEPTLVSGRVLGTDGKPLANALPDHAFVPVGVGGPGAYFFDAAQAADTPAGLGVHLADRNAGRRRRIGGGQRLRQARRARSGHETQCSRPLPGAIATRGAARAGCDWSL